MTARKRLFNIAGRGLLLVCLLIALSGCQYFNPKPLKPWDRDILARPEMRPDADAMETLMDEKIYFSKEASRGGASIGGGGCGCN
jgi:hypothetical protein